ncbi:recombination regulator RecX [uncultured Oxalicibacterium sp.]|uniref:recombination regulator RecX n=1 Tax=uncultured Oxalicibacterium sp. TaxID=1168540 RepID=UPI0025DB1F5A|nr:recombination regulator RecX [uncultured Oxalicibacterium sp.]
MAKIQLSLKARALRYLAAREHSRQELGRKLARYAQEDDDIEALLDTLQAARYLSEQRFSESLINRRAARFGNSRILSELKSHGLDAATIDDARTGLEDEAVRAAEVWQRKFGSPPTDPKERARQMRFLLQRGFSQGTIRKVLQNAGRADDGKEENEES